MLRILIGVGPIILLWVLIALGLSVWHDDYNIFLAACTAPVLAAVLIGVFGGILWWLKYAFEL